MWLINYQLKYLPQLSTASRDFGTTIKFLRLDGRRILWLIACGTEVALNKAGFLPTFPLFPPGGGEELPEILGGVAPPGLLNPDPNMTKKYNFPHPFPDQTRNYVISIYIRAQTKKSFKSISNSHISLSFLLIWNWNDKYVHTLP